MSADLAVRNGILVNGSGMTKADLLISDGLIEKIVPAGDPLSASRTIDASGKFVLPGIIDAHVHPFYADKIDTLSRAAASGGITTIIPYIGAVKAWGKAGAGLDVVRNFIAEGEKTSLVDFGVHFSLVREDIDGLADLVPSLVGLGVTSFKGFMAYGRRGMKLDDDDLLKAMQIVAGHGALFAVHAENGSVIDFLEDRSVSRGNVSPVAYPATHPPLAEAEAVFRILTLAGVASCPLYLPHISARESLEVMRLFRTWGGVEFFAETCTHYLTLTDEEMIRRGSLAKMAPPLRKKEDVDAIWSAVAEGLIDVVSSDSAGHLVKEKEPLWDDIFKTPYGIPGSETMFTVAYDEGVNRGRITLPRLVEVMSANPARIFGLYPEKGVIKEGSDADVVVFDPAARFTIGKKSRHLKVDYDVFSGRECLGAPKYVVRRGRILVEDGDLRDDAGPGRYVARKKFESPRIRTGERRNP